MESEEKSTVSKTYPSNARVLLMRGVWVAESVVDVDMGITRAGAGFYVTGAVTCDLPLECDICATVFQHPVEGSFQARYPHPALDYRTTVL